MSNYPPGVTGFESAINGPDERDHTMSVVAQCEDSPEEYDAKGTLIVWDRWDAEFEWSCEFCGEDHKVSVDTDAPDDC
jgi:hypothetical protein